MSAGSSGVSDPPTLTLTRPLTGDNNFGSVVACGGDLNADGIDDLLVTAPGNGVVTGQLYVFFGHAGGISTTPDTRIDGPDPGFRFSSAAARTTDQDGDGFDDVWGSAVGFAAGAGRVYLFGGSPTMGLRSTAILTRPGIPGAATGFYIAWLGPRALPGLAFLLAI
jgi:hypothetical protein